MALKCVLAKAKLAQAVSALKTSPASDRFVSAIKTGYLATASSRVKHISSIALTMGYKGLVEQPVKVAADYITAVGKAAVDHRLGKFQEYRTTTNLLNPKAISEIGNAGAKGLREAWQAIKTGIDPERASDVFDLTKTEFKNPLARAVQHRINAVISASNKPFFGMAYTASLLDQAQTLAKKSGQSVDYHLANISDQMAQRALDEALHTTFGDNGPVAMSVAAWKNTLRRVRDETPALSPRERAAAQASKEGLTGDAAADRAAKLMSLKSTDFQREVTVPRERAQTVASNARRGTAAGALVLSELAAPFARIGLNLAEQGVELTPLGVPYALAKALGSKDGRVLVDGVIKSVAGSASLVALGYYLRHQGVISGAGPSGQTEKNRDQAMGEQPYAVKIGNTTHRYDWVEPISFPLALGADLYEQNQNHPGQPVKAFAAAEGKNLAMLTQKGILGSFAQIADATGGDAKKGVRYITSLLSPPPILGQIAKGMDSARDRDTRSNSYAGELLNATKAKIPGLRQSLPVKMDATGSVPQRSGGLLSALTDPGNPTAVRNDSGLTEMHRLGVGISDIGRGEPISTQRAMTQEFGPLMLAVVNRTTSAPSYQSSTDVMRREMLKDQLRSVVSDANAMQKARGRGANIPRGTLQAAMGLR